MAAHSLLVPELAPAPQSARVLLVDDDLRALGYYGDALKNAGFEVVRAQSGPDALAVATDQRPDVVLADLDMPGMDGLMLLSELRASRSLADVPVLLLASDPAPQQTVEALRAGAADCLAKSIDRGELTARIRQHVVRAGELRRLREQARVDELTGIYNRRGVMEAIEIERRRAERSGTPITMLLIDLDRFKYINDTFGHAAGDQVLIGVADALTASVRTTDVVGRLGGDEFVVLLADVDADNAELVVSRIRQALARIDVAGIDCTVQASIGVVGAMDAHFSIEAMLSSADRAMYAEKRAHREPVLRVMP